MDTSILLSPSDMDGLQGWLIDWCFTARQHKIGQFVPIYQGGLLAQAFVDSQRGTYKTYSCMRYNEHTHATSVFYVNDNEN